MPKKLFKNIFILLLANVIIKPLWIFGIDLKVQNLVGAETYGFYFIVFNFSFLFHIFLDFGVHQFNNREIAQNPNLLQEQFGKLFALKGVFAIIYFTLSFALALAIGYTPLQKEMLFFLALNQMLLSFILFSRSNFTAMQWFKVDAFFSIFDRILSILFCLVLLYTSWFGFFKIQYFIYAQTIALFIAAFTSIIVVIIKGKIIFPRLDLSSTLPLVKKALPYALVVLLMTIYTRIDAIMMDKLLPIDGDNEAGIYAAGYRILDAMNMVPFLLASLLIPFFARKLKENEVFTEELWTAVRILLVVCIPFVMVVYSFHQEIIHFLYGNNTDHWGFCFQLLLYSFPFVFFTYVFGGFLTAAAKLKTISYLALVTIVFNVILNYYLIPKQGAEGAALATLLSQAIMAIAQIVVVVRNWDTKFEKTMILQGLSYTILLTLIVVGLGALSFSWMIKIIIFSIIAIILSLVLRLITIKKLRAL